MCLLQALTKIDTWQRLAITTFLNSVLSCIFFNQMFTAIYVFGHSCRILSAYVNIIYIAGHFKKYVNLIDIRFLERQEMLLV